MDKEKVKQGCAGASVLFLLLVILIIVIAPEPDQKPSRPTEPTSNSATPPKAARSPQSEALLDVIRQASLATSACKFNFEETINLIADAQEKPDNLMKAYSEAHRGEPNCQDAVDDVRQIERLKLSTEARTNNLRLALDNCAEAAELRRDGLRTIKIALDGDNSFATAQKFLDNAGEARELHSQCIDSLKSLGRDAGISVNDMSFLDT